MVEIVGDGVVEAACQVPRLYDPMVVFTPEEEKGWKTLVKYIYIHKWYIPVFPVWDKERGHTHTIIGCRGIYNT